MENWCEFILAIWRITKFNATLPPMFFSSLSRQDCTDIATLIATCNGEKGLDIADVDLIILF